ncbi:STAS domain-containing protein [Roseovarius faecimaris]|uniref:STAS domain-containing protein n=1 Tax=Roseovarius faecimaris TaxID=2494550 RepID=A0A6I6IVM7_9RHOB|nr:STAS domain-containing protein [Roseovarius faecimaris]QGX99691.1 STAS domain-containing protein [Roseovarius faecimaris]
MPSKTDANAECTIGLPVRLDLAAVADLRAGIESARDHALCLEADKVEFLGGAGAELLLAAQAEWQAHALAFSIAQPTAQFLTGLDRLGIPHSELIIEDCE